MAPRADTRFELRLPVEQLQRVDTVRGAVSRSEFTRQALERALTTYSVAGADKVLAPDAGESRAPAEATGCPECGGALSGVLERPGVNACVDCGWTG